VHASGSARAAGLPLMPLEVNGTLGKDSFGFDTAESTCSVVTPA